LEFFDNNSTFVCYRFGVMTVLHRWWNATLPVTLTWRHSTMCPTTSTPQATSSTSATCHTLQSRSVSLISLVQELTSLSDKSTLSLVQAIIIVYSCLFSPLRQNIIQYKYVWDDIIQAKYNTSKHIINIIWRALGATLCSAPYVRLSVCLFVRLFVTLVFHDHIVLNVLKIITQTFPMVFGSRFWGAKSADLLWGDVPRTSRCVVENKPFMT